MSDEKIRAEFWKHYDLTDFTKAEWEALCDRCGKCCLLKLEDEDTQEIRFTNVACRLFDDKTCTCTNYTLRRQLVAGCVVLTPENIERNAYWMPQTCAYRLKFQGQDLPAWHPLLAGTKKAMHDNGHSMLNRTLAEFDVDEDDLEDHVIEDL